jgi:hypothetical protein
VSAGDERGLPALGDDEPVSNSLALVRFPDGEIRVAYFFGDPEMVLPFLFPLADATAVWEAGMDPLMARAEALDANGVEPADAEDVQIWADYGQTFWWKGRASRSTDTIVDGLDPRGMAAEFGDPTGEPPRPVHDEVPDWVPSDWRRSTD